jgi:hypothetical protein
MTAAAATAEITTVEPVTAVDIFRARCEARAMLYAAGALELHEAVDILQYFAVRTGLVDELGQDQVQRLMSDAFARWRA